MENPSFFYKHLLLKYWYADLIITPTYSFKVLIDDHVVKSPVVALSNGIDLNL